MSMSWVWHLLSSHLLTILGFTLGALLCARLLTERRPAGSTLAWMLAIALIPYVGVPLYFVIGGRKLPRRAARKQRLYRAHALPAAEDGIGRMLCASGVAPPREPNRVALLPTGEAAYAAHLELIESARHAIHVSTLILGNDEVGAAVLERLTAKAAAGVEVRLLLDALFALRTHGRGLKALEQAGGKVARFMPVVHLPFRGSANLRLHRKIVAVDGRSAIVGGMNLAREYMGPTPLPGRWRDLSARIDGPAVGDIDAVFAADWQFAAGETLVPRPAHGAAEGAARIQVVGSGPDVESDRIYDAFLCAVFAARTRLWLTTPYFVPDEALARAMLLAVRRGVDVRVVVPARSNHRIADLAGAAYLRELAAAGAHVLAYRPGMMHAKVVIVDDTLAVLGSANLDMRSLFLDYEIALFFTTAAEIAALAGWVEGLVPECGALRAAGRLRAGAENVARLFGPLV